MKEKGFTLIELMIAIAIIGILAAVAIPEYQKYRDKKGVKQPESQAYSEEYKKDFEKETSTTIKF